MPKRDAVSEERGKLHNVELNEMGGVCGAYGGEDKHIQGFGEGTCKKETTLDNQA